MKREQLEDLLCNYDRLASLSKSEVEKNFNKDVAVMVGYDQKSPYHCYDLWEHTLHTLSGLSEDADIYLKIAAFFHDIGKPEVGFEKNDKFVYYGHPAKSAEMTRKILYDAGYSKDEINIICFYIAQHDDFISWVTPEEKKLTPDKPYPVEINEKRLEKHINKINKKYDFPVNIKHWIALMDLCHADAAAHADEVWKDGKLISSVEVRLNRIDYIKNIMKNLDMSYRDSCWK